MTESQNKKAQLYLERKEKRREEGPIEPNKAWLNRA